MDQPLADIVGAYDPERPLAKASTIPASWYTDPRIHTLEQRAVFGSTWQRWVDILDRLREPGEFLTTTVGGSPVVLVRDQEGQLRAFYNVCRHHAAEVVTEPHGKCTVMQCPYHAWTYALDGRLKGMPDFDGVEEFDTADHGLMPIRVDTWENFVFVNLSRLGGHATRSLADDLCDIPERTRDLNLICLRFAERREYELPCNWKVFVDNYLDGGYHVPHVHKRLNSVLDYAQYTIENGQRYCLQRSPVIAAEKDGDLSSVRRGEEAYYYWIYPNFMVNWYEGVMDTNLVLPVGLDRCRVIFDFYFEDVSRAAAEHNRTSVEVGELVQQEDIDVCASVQRGLSSGAYDTGRLSVRREAGEHLFHKLLHADLSRDLQDGAVPSQSTH